MAQLGEIEGKPFLLACLTASVGEGSVCASGQTSLESGKGSSNPDAPEMPLSKSWLRFFLNMALASGPPRAELLLGRNGSNGARIFQNTVWHAAEAVEASSLASLPTGQMSSE